jgi:hypothetical protein
LTSFFDFFDFAVKILRSDFAVKFFDKVFVVFVVILSRETGKKQPFACTI